MLKSVLLALLSGFTLALTQPLVIESFGSKPIDQAGLLGVLAIVAYVPLIWVLSKSSVKSAFWLSFVAHVFYFMITLYWIIVAMTVFGGIAFWVSSLVLSLMALILATYFATAFSVARFVELRFQFPLWLLIPAFYCGIEYVRNYVFVGGFPWASVGYAFAQIPVLLQGASLFGIYGLIFFMLLINAAIVHTINNWHQRSFFPFYLSICLTIAAICFGFWSLSREEPGESKLRVAVIQGNIEQGIKNKQAIFSDEILAKYLSLQQKVLSENPDVIVWPEASFPQPVAANAPKLPQLEGKTAMLIGAVSYEKARPQQNWDLTHYNSAILLDKDQNIVGRFDKTHLVPFGEYVPWPMKGIVKKVVPNMGAFGIGSSYKPIALTVNSRSILVGTTICYEGIFPEISRTFVRNGAQILFNLTNDAWYGVSSAPYQHLNMYVIRAVETGRSYVRATNTGVSAWIDPKGGIHNQTGLYEDATFVADVPFSAVNTLYLQVGDALPQLCLLAMLVLWTLGLLGKDVFLRRRKKREWFLGAVGFLAIAWAYFHYGSPEFAIDEAAKTKWVMLTILGFAVGCGALTDRPWGRRAIIGSGLTLTVVGLFLSVFEGMQFLVLAVVGFSILILGYGLGQTFSRR